MFHWVGTADPQQDSGGIVNISSVYGLAPIPGNSAYCAAKFAVRGFTEALRHELRGTGVNATVVHPGGIKTNIARNARVGVSNDRGRTREEMARDFAAGALTRPDQAADIICRGVEKGKARILVGPDAYVFDVLIRLTPTYYYDITSRLESMLVRLR